MMIFTVTIYTMVFQLYMALEIKIDLDSLP
jgi:hypothetical protein